ncbi:hypothetical protein [Yinghuangia sp. YIM S09857]|uniref:hypothetical protein n=1 Tax=Yinghuangia sp. YIM S09857 TaxID=3436929 RepID=UPI003F52B1E1
MDDVRLTPAERRALELIEAELRKDRDLDRAMRRMRVPRTGRRPLRRLGSADEGAAGGPAQERSAGQEASAGADVPTSARDGGDTEAPEFPFAAATSAAARHRERRRVWALALVLSIVFAALLTAGTLFFLVFALVLVTLAASAGVVWMAVSFYLRKPDTG